MSTVRVRIAHLSDPHFGTVVPEVRQVCLPTASTPRIDRDYGRHHTAPRRGSFLKPGSPGVCAGLLCLPAIITAAVNVGRAE